MHRSLNLSGIELATPNFYLVNVAGEFRVSLIGAADGKQSPCARAPRHIALPNQDSINEKI
jgi:hypothetical protein